MTKTKQKYRPKRKKPKIDDFYRSYEWATLRFKVLKKYGAECMCCGARREDGFMMNVDHIKPRNKFPKLELEFDNLQVLCALCNKGKGSWDRTDFRLDDEPDELTEMFLNKMYLDS